VLSQDQSAAVQLVAKQRGAAALLEAERRVSVVAVRLTWFA
jgi:hypothetical protein